VRDQRRDEAYAHKQGSGQRHEHDLNAVAETGRRVDGLAVNNLAPG